MRRSDFVKNLVSVFGIGILPDKWLVNYTKIYLLQSFVRGFKFYDGQDLLQSFVEGDLLYLKREPDNKFDEFAIAVYFNNNKIGFVPKEHNEILARIMDAELLGLQAEITHLNKVTIPWENVCFAIYVLKEISSDYPDYLSTINTPNYTTFKNGNSKYFRVYWEEEKEDEHQVDYYKLMVENSGSDEIYDFIHNNFASPADLEKAIKQQAFIINKNRVPEKLLNDDLLKTLNNTIIEIENIFAEDGFLVANVDRLYQFPEKIKKFEKVFDTAGRTFYEVVLK